jgi:imidazoleglycerol phosphate dehydratase HisB
MDPRWDPQNEADEWARHHFIHLTTESFKRTRVKPLKYSQVTAVQQRPDETPMAFLQHLKETITEHTTVDLEVLLRDKFLTQSAQTFVDNFKSW